MARPLRFEYPGAVYHVMARGDGGKAVFEEDRDRRDFIDRLGTACVGHGWKIHAWVLMGNHFHLLLETPEANLVSGMKRLLGGFSQAWNRRRKRRGHVFQGRYKSVPVTGNSDEYYLRIVADYIHLNPARGGLAGAARGRLVDYAWSSLPAYAAGRGAGWQETARVLQSFELARDGRGRRAYVAWLEARAAEGGKVSAKAMEALKRGWYLGEKSFKDHLLALLEGSKRIRMKGSRAGEALKEHGATEAERLADSALDALGLPSETKKLAALKKGDRRKVLVAMLLRERTIAGNAWIAKRLSMGHPSAVSRALSNGARDASLRRDLRKLDGNATFKD